MLCVYAMFLIALSSIALAVLLALGPLFIAMLFFDATKRFFSAWIAQLANYALITILTVMIAALLLQIVQSYAAQTAARGSGNSDRGCTQHDVDRGAGLSDPAPGHAHRRRLGRRPRAEFVRRVEPHDELGHANGHRGAVPIARFAGAHIPRIIRLHPDICGAARPRAEVGDGLEHDMTEIHYDSQHQGG